MKRLIRIGTLSLLLFPLIGSSQGNTPVVPGARIRVTALGAVGAPRSGTVVTTAADKQDQLMDETRARLSASMRRPMPEPALIA